MKLSELPPGTNALVESIDERDNASRRLMEMGIVPGVSIKVIKAAPFGDPIEIRLMGYNLAIRRREADTVAVLTKS